MHRHMDRPRPWRRFIDHAAQTERTHVLTEDGQRLVLRRLRIESDPELPPVMLLHGLGANHHTFHFAERSLAEWLAARGHDVWLPELRGHGSSTTTDYDWRIDEYLLHDIPALLNEIRRQTGREDVRWVGHSMGGVLLYCYGIMHPEEPINRGLAIASALDYSVGSTGFRGLLKLRPLIEAIPAIPWGTLTHLLAPAIGRGVPLERFNVWPTNIEPKITRRIHARVFHSIPTSLLHSLSTTFEDEGFRLADGFEFVTNSQNLSFPVRLIAGSQDQQVSVDAIHHTSGLIGENASVRVFGREYGEVDDYGHFDLILGRRAQVEVWPEIASWLED